MAYPTSIDAPDVTMQAGSLLSTNDHANDHRLLGSAVINLENKVGINAGSAGLNQILVGQGAGSSSWGTVWNQANLGSATLTNGTINNAVMGTPAITGGTMNTGILGTPTITLGSDAQGDIFYRSAGGTVTNLAPGSSGNILTTQGAGANPIWTAVLSYSDTRFYVNSFTHDVSGTGAQVITGVPFAPKSVLFFAAGDSANIASFGLDTGLNSGAIYDDGNRVAGRWNSDAGTRSIVFMVGNGTYSQANITALGTGGFTISWANNGSPTGTATVFYMAFK